MQTFAESGITDAISNVLSILTSAISFLTGNPWLMVLVAAPIVFGILAALLAIFKHCLLYTSRCV